MAAKTDVVTVQHPARSHVRPCSGSAQVGDLGEGTFAWVEQAELQQPGRPPRVVAVKRLRTALIEGDQELLDFVREGALLKRLRHPCVPLCHGSLCTITASA